MNNLPIADIDSIEIKTQYCIDDQTRDKQIAYSIANISGRIQPGIDRGNDSIAVVCYGPSIRDNIEEIKKCKYIITCSGAHKYLIERGIIPTWHVDVDPREHKLELLGQPHPDVEYLISSAVHPKYIDLIKKYKVKLWHGYGGDNINDAPTIFPRGDWVFSGGCTAGLRTLLLARFLGFRNIELFGMDCSFPHDNVGEHADFHPNPSKKEAIVLTTFKGIVYKTTIGMIEYARQFFKEKTLLPDISIVMHGAGLLQHMAYADWKDPNGTDFRTQSVLAFLSPDIASKEYIEQNKILHQSNPNYGVSGSKYTTEVIELSTRFNTNDILDYGCGKGTLSKSLPFPIKEYDPAIEEKSKVPRPADIVICTDVLEHIEPNYLENVLGDIVRCTKKYAFFAIHNGPAIKTLPDGRNTHLIQEDKDFWMKNLSKYFVIERCGVLGNTILIHAKPKFHETNAELSLQELYENENQELSFTYIETENLKFVVINKQTRWRINTLKTKEPCTIEWINSFTEDDVFVDIGANIGLYSLYAAKNKNVKTYAFEPESQNYAMLMQNIFINELSDGVRAYNLAISDKIGTGELALTEFMPGSSCHQLDSILDPHGNPGKFVFNQSTFAVTLDYLIDNKMIEQPTHIKIDVDGLEHKIIYGGIKTLQKVKSLLVEVNRKLDDHQRMIKILNALGFYYDDNQVNRSLRKEGPFEGVGEYVFRRS